MALASQTVVVCFKRGISAFAALLLIPNAGIGSAQAFDDDPSYPSPEAAFESAFLRSGLAESAYRANREYAAAIFQLPDGSWHCTTPIAGSRLASSIPYHAVPVNAVQIVGAHTHGQPRIPEDPRPIFGTDFSLADRNNALHNYLVTNGRIAVQLLLSSDLRVLRLTLSRATATTTAGNSSSGNEILAKEEVLGSVQFAESGANNFPALPVIASSAPNLATQVVLVR